LGARRIFALGFKRIIHSRLVPKLLAGKKVVRNMAKKELCSKKDCGLVSKVLVGGSVVAVALAGIGYLGTDIWLASTQWLLVAAVLVLFGVYTKMYS
jgi:hypothetical protein